MSKKKKKQTKKQKWLRSLSKDEFGQYLQKQNFSSEGWFKNLLQKTEITKLETECYEYGYFWRYFRNRRIGPFFADFYFPGMNLVIEIDGSSHDTHQQKVMDARKDNYLITAGYKIIRIKYQDTAKCNAVFDAFYIIRTKVLQHINDTKIPAQPEDYYRYFEHLIEKKKTKASRKVKPVEDSKPSWKPPKLETVVVIRRPAQTLGN